MDRLSKSAQAIDLAFDAALGQTSWESAVTELVRAYNGAGGVIFDLNKSNGTFENWSSVALNDTPRYVAEMNAINPRMHYSLSQPHTHVLTDLQIQSQRTIDSSEFYHWMRDECGLQYFLGARILDAGPVSTFMSIEYANGEASPDSQSLRGFERAARHFSHACQLRNARSGEKKSDGSLDGFLSSLTNTALLFLDEDCKFAFANAAGERLLATDHRLWIEAGLVCMADDRDQSVLDHQMDAIKSARADGHLLPMYPVTIASSRGSCPLLMRVIALPSPLRGSGGRWCQTCLMFQSSLLAQDMAETLSEVYALTSREAELVLSLRENGNLQRAADAIEMGRNTSRVHMQHVFEKMKINSQLEVVQLTEMLSVWRNEAKD